MTRTQSCAESADGICTVPAAADNTVVARKQLCWYLKGVSHANYYKEQIVRMDTLEDVYRVSAGVKRDLR